MSTCPFHCDKIEWQVNKDNRKLFHINVYRSNVIKIIIYFTKFVLLSVYFMLRKKYFQIGYELCFAQKYFDFSRPYEDSHPGL